MCNECLHVCTCCVCSLCVSPVCVCVHVILDCSPGSQRLDAAKEKATQRWNTWWISLSRLATHTHKYCFTPPQNTHTHKHSHDISTHTNTHTQTCYTQTHWCKAEIFLVSLNGSNAGNLASLWNYISRCLDTYTHTQTNTNAKIHGWQPAFALKNSSINGGSTRLLNCVLMSAGMRRIHLNVCPRADTKQHTHTHTHTPAQPNNGPMNANYRHFNIQSRAYQSCSYYTFRSE